MAMREFKNEYKYKLYLRELFDNVSKDRDYNVFLHCVTNASKYLCKDVNRYTSDVEIKINSILANGLDLDGVNDYGRYGSIGCTTKFFGEADQILDIENFMKYDYLSYATKVCSVILLIPKYIQVDQEMVEFSSCGEDLRKQSQHDKGCWFDIVKDSFSPVEFTFGYQVYDKETQSFKFVLNENHYSFCQEEKQMKIDNYFAQKIKKEIKICKEKYGITDVKSILIKKSEEHMQHIEDFLMDP